VNIAFLLGRIVLGGYFLKAGINHFTGLSMLAGYTKAKGVPAPEVAVLGTGVLLMLGGASLVLGAWPVIGIGLLAVFLAGVTPMINNFWTLTDPAQRMGERINFEKNLALLGALLMLLMIPRPWWFSIGG